MGQVYSFKEASDSPSGTPARFELRWILKGRDLSFLEVMNYAIFNGVPASYLGLPLVRNGITVDPPLQGKLTADPQYYSVRASYAKEDQEDEEPPTDTPPPTTRRGTVSHNVTASQLLVKSALQQVHEGYNDQVAAAVYKHNGALNMDLDKQPQGTNRYVEEHSFTVPHTIGDLTTEEAKRIRGYVAKVNSKDFYEHAAGEVIYLGFSGREGRDVTVAHNFRVIPNTPPDQAVIGGVTVDQQVQGWDYLHGLWQRADNAAGNDTTTQLHSWYIDRIQERADLNEIFDD